MLRTAVIVRGLCLCLSLAVSAVIGRLCAAEARVESNNVRKLSDVVIYEDAKFYAAFPSIVRRPDGELLVAFRRAPDRRVFGETGINHNDPNRYLVLVP